MSKLRTEPKSPKRLGRSEFPKLRKDLDFHRKKNQPKYEKETVLGGTPFVAS